ncbi:MAG: hypothetical protein HY904_21475 [Deltaproteobacteria bacterium]|nr:hypothetical protein [Deltaproteobacteria bacterium]
MRIGNTRALVLALVFAAPLARAAEATDVLDAIDGDDYFDANAELSYRAHTKTAKITREDIRAGKPVEVTEFQTFEHSHQVIPRIRIGVFQDIEIFAQLPLTAWEQRMGWFHPRNGNTAEDPNKKGYSTFLRDMCTYGQASDGTNANGAGVRPAECDTQGYPATERATLSGNEGSWPVNHEYSPIEKDGKLQPRGGDYTGRDTDWAIDPNRENFNPQFNSVRGAVAYSLTDGFFLFPKGIGDAEVGLAFSPYTIGRFNDERDSAMPTMRVEVKYQLPTGYIDTPGPGCQRIIDGKCVNGKFPTKREQLKFVDANKFDPGGVGSGLHRFSAGIAMSKRFKLMDPYMGIRYTLGVPQGYPNIAPERDWKDFAFWSNVVNMQAGVEFAPLYAFPDLEKTVNFRIITGLNADYVARHRGPSEMSDALHKWTMVDHYVAVLGRLGLVLSVPFVTLRGLLEVGHETPHFLTGEVAGRDPDGDGISQKEINVHYNAVLDTPGRRVKVTETLVANGMMTLAITF